METMNMPTITSVKIEGDQLIIQSGETVFKWKLAEISKKLAKATVSEKNNFKLSPSGYGIHWPQLDEDLSLHGLLRLVA